MISLLFCLLSRDLAQYQGVLHSILAGVLGGKLTLLGKMDTILVVNLWGKEVAVSWLVPGMLPWQLSLVVIMVIGLGGCFVKSSRGPSLENHLVRLPQDIARGSHFRILAWEVTPGFCLGPTISGCLLGLAILGCLL